MSAKEWTLGKFLFEGGDLSSDEGMVMEYNAKRLLKKIDDYFAGTISKADLGKWANSAYYDLLRGGYIENEKISIYPFIKTIST